MEKWGSWDRSSLPRNKINIDCMLPNIHFVKTSEPENQRVILQNGFTGVFLGKSLLTGWGGSVQLPTSARIDIKWPLYVLLDFKSFTLTHWKLEAESIQICGWRFWHSTIFGISGAVTAPPSSLLRNRCHTSIRRTRMCRLKRRAIFTFRCWQAAMCKFLGVRYRDYVILALVGDARNTRDCDAFSTRSETALEIFGIVKSKGIKKDFVEKLHSNLIF